MYPFSATATDNVDLKAGHFGYDFYDTALADSIMLPVRPFNVSGWHRPIIPTEVVAANMEFVRSLETVVGDTIAGTMYRPRWVRVRVWDHSHPVGRHSTQRNNLVDNTIPAAGTSFFAASRADQGRVRRAELSADGLRFTVSGMTGTFVNPFARVYFLYEVTDPATSAKYWRFLGDGNLVQVEDLGTGTTGRKWIFTVTGAQAIPANTPVRAVGISAAGEALIVGITTPPPPAT
jgi:hypothetical protein